MSVILTNIRNNELNQNIINKSFTKIKNHGQFNYDELNEIFLLNEETSKQEWNFENIKVNKFLIAMDKDMEDVYENINNIIEDILEKKEFINVIVDTSFLGYIILEILIKNFNISDVFILDGNQLNKAHPCGCGSENLGF